MKLGYNDVVMGIDSWVIKFTNNLGNSFRIFQTKREKQFVKARVAIAIANKMMICVVVQGSFSQTHILAKQGEKSLK